MDWKRKRATFWLAPALLAAVVLPAGKVGSPFAAPRAATAPAAPAVRAPLALGPAPDLNIAFTAQVIGWIEPCG